MNKDERLTCIQAVIQMTNAIINHGLTEELGNELKNLSDVILTIVEKSKAEENERKGW